MHRAKWRTAKDRSFSGSNPPAHSFSSRLLSPQSRSTEMFWTDQASPSRCYLSVRAPYDRANIAEITARALPINKRITYNPDFFIGICGGVT